MKFDHCKVVNFPLLLTPKAPFEVNYAELKASTNWISVLVSTFNLEHLHFTFQKQGDNCAILEMEGRLPVEKSTHTVYPTSSSIFYFVENLYTYNPDSDIFESIARYYSQQAAASDWFRHVRDDSVQTIVKKSDGNPVRAAHETLITWHSQNLDYEVYMSYGQICYHQKTPSSKPRTNILRLKSYFQPPQIDHAVGFFNKKILNQYSRVESNTILKYLLIKMQRDLIEDEEFLHIQYDVQIRREAG